MKRAIITGATGAIGTALVKTLLANDVEVLILYRKDSNRNHHIPNHPCVRKICCDLDQLSSVQNDTGNSYDAFFHLAWAGTTGNQRNDMSLQIKNIQYTIDAVEAAGRFGCSVFIGAGSQAEYGRVDGVLRPDTPAFPENGYGMAKLCAGQMSREKAHQLGIRHIWMRILSVYGICDGKQSMVMSTISKLKANISPEMTKGEQLWDYLYSEDAANAFYLAGKSGKDSKVYVLGSGQVKPLSEYICKIQELTNSKTDVKLGALPYSDRQVMYLCADISELRRDTGWNPEISFEEGIEKILENWD